MEMKEDDHDQNPFHEWRTLVIDHGDGDGDGEGHQNHRQFDESNLMHEGIDHNHDHDHHQQENSNVEKIQNQQDLSSSNGSSMEANNDQKIIPCSSSSSSSLSTGGAILWKKANNGSLAQRRAEKCGFNASKITTTTDQFKTLPTQHSLQVSSPFLTIPSGISPAALLDSPVMLPNTQAQSSPTTGSFQFPTYLHGQMMLSSSAPATDTDNKNFFNFSSQLKHRQVDNTVSSSIPCVSTTRNQNQQPPHFKFPSESQKPAAANVADTNRAVEAFRANLRSNNFSLPHKLLPMKREYSKQEMEKKGTANHPGSTVAKSSDDGYNWRKYGQKHVKGSEFPRSYFKCTHTNCPVKKKVERSHDGEITEIVYKGVHNHPKSQVNGRLMYGSSNPYTEMSDMSESIRSGFRVENGMVSRNVQSGGRDWRGDGLDGTSTTSVLTESSDLLSGSQAKSRGVFGSPRGPDLLSTRDGEDEDRATQGSTSFGEDGDGEESEAKRRKKESCSMEAIGPSRSAREPKVVVQIESEIDVLDDGYRWRKYGQKVVKGNPNPRSYYKCTSAGCPVRKHVERASDNLKSVITTYEGKHNHEVPSKTNNSSSNCNNITNFHRTSSNNHSNIGLPRSNPNLSKPGMQVQNYPLHFDTKPTRGGGNEFMRTNFLSNIGSDMNIGGAPSIYQLAFPTLANHISYSPFLINPNASEAPMQIPNSSMGLPLNLPGSSNVALGNYRFNNYPGPGSAIQSSTNGQQFREIDTRMIQPKEEQQKDDDNLYESCLSISDQDATSFFQALGNY